jgi:hypothetical protein
MNDKEKKVIQNLRKKKTFSRKLFILMMLSLVIFTAGVQSLEAGACERAFVNCMNELFAETNMFWIVYCANGYAFCLKYMD